MYERVPSQDQPVGSEDAEPPQQGERNRGPEPITGEDGQSTEPVLKGVGETLRNHERNHKTSQDNHKIILRYTIG
jgi:hypothetical protein